MLLFLYLLFFLHKIIRLFSLRWPPRQIRPISLCWKYVREPRCRRSEERSKTEGMLYIKEGRHCFGRPQTRCVRMFPNCPAKLLLLLAAPKRRRLVFVRSAPTAGWDVRRSGGNCVPLFGGHSLGVCGETARIARFAAVPERSTRLLMLKR